MNTRGIVITLARVFTRLMVTGAAATVCMTGACRDMENECGVSAGVVTAVLDGDTIEIDGVHKVRLIGIDAPESGECWSARAKAASIALMLDRLVWLEFVSSCRDRYDRLLAHVIIPEKGCASEILADDGHVCPWNLENDDPRADDIRRAASRAAGNGYGFWGFCQEIPCRIK